jgi:hypothetical protein
MIERTHSESAQGNAEDARIAGVPIAAEAADRGDRPDRPEIVATAAAESDVDTPLLAADEAATFEQRWQRLQASFVDEPRRALDDAERLIADLMQAVSSGLAATRAQRETAPDEVDNASTEELRLAFMRYRSLFQRLVSS